MKDAGNSELIQTHG